MYVIVIILYVIGDFVAADANDIVIAVLMLSSTLSLLLLYVCVLFRKTKKMFNVLRQ